MSSTQFHGEPMVHPPPPPADPAPVVDQPMVEQQIVSTEFFRTRVGMTICAATLRNGYIAIGHSGRHPSDLDAACAAALRDAKRSTRPLLDYALCESQWSLQHPQDDSLIRRQLSTMLVSGADPPLEVQASFTMPEIGASTRALVKVDDTPSAGSEFAAIQLADERTN